MAVSNLSLKLDAQLQAELQHFERAGGEERVSVTLLFAGALAPIEALGFETHAVFGQEAIGLVRFTDLAALADHEGVRWISVGQEEEPEVQRAGYSTSARARTAAGVSVDGVWFVPPGASAGSATVTAAAATGNGVIVAILDTGIDYQHPAFMREVTPQKATRIVRIWDMGIPAATESEAPALSLIGSATTYGREFTGTEIDAALNSSTPSQLGHRDCNGHGTHVAGIAAGGPRANAAFVGLAPEADILVVKFLDNARVRFGLAGSLGPNVAPDVRIRDAILYCLRFARSQNRPVVINLSSSRYSAPGDGLDRESSFVDDLLEHNATAGPLHFPKGAVFVTTSGNKGSTAAAAAARIVVPASGVVTVPFELTDSRQQLQTRFVHCERKRYKPAIKIHLWYRRSTPSDATRVALKLPLQSSFTSDMPIGGNVHQGFFYRTGPPRSLVLAGTPEAWRHSIRVTHEGNPAVNHPDGGTVRRHHIQVELKPKVRSGTVTYAEGIYELRLSAPAGTEFFVICDRISWAPGKIVGFGVADTMADGLTPRDPSIHVESEHSMSDPGGRRAVTVGALDDRSWASPVGRLASLSSRGPMRQYGVPPQQAIDQKPDVAAPGVRIVSSVSAQTEAGVTGVHTPAWTDGHDRFEPMSGTSMASPMVAGAVALMLEKNPDLTAADVKRLLRQHADPGTAPAAPPDDHDRAYGGGMLNVLQSYLHS